MPLSDVELRVLGALMEKDRTTPESYPLTSQALLSACNQRTSRDPVTAYHLQEVTAAMNRLRDRGLAETVQEAGDRVPKHRHRAASALDLDQRQFAVLAVLLLRGEQTPGELRGRTDRYVGFGSVAEVDEVLKALESRSAALVKNLGRGPGQSQDRWVHTLGADEEKMVPRARPARTGWSEAADGRAGASAAESGMAGYRDHSARTDGRQGAEPNGTEIGAAGSSEDSVSSLLQRLEALEERVAALEADR